MKFFILALYGCYFKLVLAAKGPLVTDLVYFDIEIDHRPAGRIIFGLFGKVVPKTVQNFVRLAVHDKGYGYKGSSFTKILKGYTVMGGAFQYEDTTGGMSWFGAPFAHENYKLKHYDAGWVSMASMGEDSISSQFTIVTTDDLGYMREWYDNKKVVFAAVVHGIRLVDRIAEIKTFGMAPTKDVVVADCGTLQMNRKFAIAKDYISGNLVSFNGTKF